MKLLSLFLCFSFLSFSLSAMVGSSTEIQPRIFHTTIPPLSQFTLIRTRGIAINSTAMSIQAFVLRAANGAEIELCCGMEVCDPAYAARDVYGQSFEGRYYPKGSGPHLRIHPDLTMTMWREAVERWCTKEAAKNTQ